MIWRYAETHYIRNSLGGAWGIGKGDGKRLRNSEYFSDFYKQKNDLLDGSGDLFERVEKFVAEEDVIPKPKVRRIIRDGIVIKEAVIDGKPI